MRAIVSAPLWVKRSGCSVSPVNAASFATARWSSLVSAGVAGLGWRDRRRGGGLGGESGALEHGHAEAAREVVRRARAEGTGTDDDDVGGGDHAGSLPGYLTIDGSRTASQGSAL